jgi:hypothetical protein
VPHRTTGTSTPSGTGYPSGPALEAARQRALQAPGGAAIPPTAAGVGADRSSTSEVGSDSVTEPETPGLPNQAQSNRDAVGNPERMAGGGAARGRVQEAPDGSARRAWDAHSRTCRSNSPTARLPVAARLLSRRRSGEFDDPIIMDEPNAADATVFLLSALPTSTRKLTRPRPNQAIGTG